jgi:predicted component of type VI protein secretion system
MAHAYFVLRETGKSDRVLIWDTRTLSIGRAPGNDLVIDDDEISRKHALIEKKDDRFAVGDYRTGNGTFVNGQRIQQSAEIRAGDVIRVGKVELVFVIDAAHPGNRGAKVEYASHMKTVGSIPKGADGDRTMLSLTDTAGADDEFVVEPERSSGAGAFRSGVRDDGPGSDFQVRDLDESLDQMDLELASDDMGLSDGLEPAAAAAPPPRAPAPKPVAAVAAKPPAARPPAPSAPAARPPPPKAPAARPPAATPSGDTTRTRPSQGPAAPVRAPASAAAPSADPMQRLRALKTLLDEGLITEAEYQAKRARILDAM